MIIHDVEQGTDEWFSLRMGRPTSSRFSDLLTGTGKASTSMAKYAYELATESYLGKVIDDGFQGNSFTERGTLLEPVSRAWYEMQNQIPVQEVGFITVDDGSYGASTDGLVGDDGLVEFKNLIARRFMEMLHYHKKNGGKPEPAYIPQLQGELLVTGRKWADLVFYHPDFEPVCIRVEPDLEYQEKLVSRIADCIKKRDQILSEVSEAA